MCVFCGLNSILFLYCSRVVYYRLLYRTVLRIHFLCYVDWPITCSCNKHSRKSSKIYYWFVQTKLCVPIYTWTISANWCMPSRVCLELSRIEMELNLISPLSENNVFMFKCIRRWSIYHQTYKAPLILKPKCFSSRLAVVFAQSIEAMC